MQTKSDGINQKDHSSRPTRCVACGELTETSKRGRCGPCFALALKCIEEGYTSWKFLEEVGFALPLKKKVKNETERNCNSN